MKQIFAYKAFVSELKGCKNKKNKNKTRGTKLGEKRKRKILIRMANGIIKHFTSFHWNM